MTTVLEKNEPARILKPFEHDWRDLQLVEELDPEGRSLYRYADVQ